MKWTSILANCIFHMEIMRTTMGDEYKFAHFVHAEHCIRRLNIAIEQLKRSGLILLGAVRSKWTTCLSCALNSHIGDMQNKVPIYIHIL